MCFYKTLPQGDGIVFSNEGEADFILDNVITPRRVPTGTAGFMSFSSGGIGEPFGSVRFQKGELEVWKDLLNQAGFSED